MGKKVEQIKEEEKIKKDEDEKRKIEKNNIINKDYNAPVEVVKEKNDDINNEQLSEEYDIDDI